MTDYIDENNQITYLLVWTSFGFEDITNLTKLIEEEILDKLIEKERIYKSAASIIDFWLLRARLNPHRNYNVYTINVSGDITEDYLLMLSKDNPQNFANLVKEKGTKLYKS
jgi:hypothetical protein